MNIKYTCTYKNAEGKEQKINFNTATYVLEKNGNKSGYTVKFEEDVVSPLVDSELDTLYNNITSECTDVKINMSINGAAPVLVFESNDIIGIRYVVEPRETGFKKVVGIN